MNFKISQESAQKILDYLQLRPYREVAQLIQALMTLTPLPDPAPPPPIPAEAK